MHFRLVPTSKTLKGVMRFSPNSFALLATLVEDRPIMSVNIVSQFPVFHFLATLQRGLSAIAELIVY